jgi:hypothetical protein
VPACGGGRTRSSRWVLRFHSCDYEEYLLSFGMYCHAIQQKTTDVSGDCTASVFRVGSQARNQKEENGKPVSCLAYFSTLMMEAVWSPEMSVDFYQTTWHSTAKTVLLFLSTVVHKRISRNCTSNGRWSFPPNFSPSSSSFPLCWYSCYHCYLTCQLYFVLKVC